MTYQKHSSNESDWANKSLSTREKKKKAIAALNI